mgnify:CR=1 FL=1
MTAAPAAPYVRLDSWRGVGRGFEFRGLRREVAARRLDEVLPALRAVEDAARAGLHAAGFLAYEAAPAFDAALRVPPPHPTLPLLWFGLFAERAPAPPPAASERDFALGAWAASLTPAEHARQVTAIREWIAAGETYQVNHTFRLRARFRGSDAALYAALGRAQRAEFCALIRLPGVSILSLSPELFVRWRARELEVRPMKGTRARGRWRAEDDALAAELRASAKERAENLMIVDLLRNDLGRIAEYGSVRVPRLFEAERYPSVHQLTSTVTATARPGVGLVERLHALFPCGSVTGAPKVRTMQKIAELEREPRGVYCGALGFVSPDEAAFNVPIRTLLLDHAAGSAELGVGSGVTYDSDAASEYRECLQKAAFTHAGAGDFELLETLRYEPAAGFAWLDEHLARLTWSAERLGFAPPPADVAARLEAAVRGESDARRVRLRLARDGAVGADVQPLDPLPAVLRARLAVRPVDRDDPLLYHKTTARALYEEQRAAHPGYDEVLLRNREGEPTEFTTGNLLVRRGGRLLTPPVAAGLLPGVLRGVLLARGEIEEMTLTLDDLRSADAIYLLNSVRGRVPVTLT